MYFLVVAVLLIVAIGAFAMGYPKLKDPDQQQKAYTFVGIGLVAVLILILIQFEVIPLG